MSDATVGRSATDPSAGAAARTGGAAASSETASGTGTPVEAGRRSLRPTGDELRPIAVDLGIALVLAMLAVSAFAPSYGGYRYLVAGAVAALVGLVVTYCCDRLRLSALPTLLVLLLAFVAAGGVAVPGSAIAGFLPGPGVPGDLVSGLVHGWSRVLTTAPPVGVANGMGVIPYLCAFVAAAGGALLALHTRLSVVPAVPALTALVTAVLLGTSLPGSLLLQGALFGGVVIAWAALRASRNRAWGATEGHEFRLGRGLTSAAFLAIVVAFALGAGPSLPFASHRARFVLREHTEPPFDPQQYPSPLNGYRHYRILHKLGGSRDTPQLTVTGLPPGALLRMATMDTYNGVVFVVSGSGSESERPNGTGRFDRVGAQLADPAANGPGKDASLRVTVAPNADTKVWVPLAGALRTIRFTGSRAGDLDAAFRYNTVSHVGADPLLLQPGDGYVADVRIRQVPIEAAARDKVVGNAPLDTSLGFGQLVPPPPVSFGTEARKLIGTATTPLARIDAIEKAMREQGRFSDGQTDAQKSVVAGHSISRLVKFFSETPTVGDDEQYAAAMCLLLRTQDIPCRVAMGYVGSAKPVASQTFKGVDMRAWVEVPFVGVGWVPFFPTPNKPPDDTPQPRPQEVQTQSQPSPPTTYLQVPPPEDNRNQRHQQEHKAGSGFHIPGFVIAAVKYVGLPLVALGLLVLAIAALKTFRMRRRRSRGTPVDRVRNAWVEVLDRLRDHGLTVPRRATRVEVAAAVDPGRWPSGALFAARVDRAMFDRADPDDQVVAELWAQVDEQVKALSTGLGWKERLWSTVNLSSMWPVR